MIVTLSVTFLRVFLDSLAGYALARLRFRGRGAAFATIVAVMAVPGVVLLIPKFLIIRQLGIYDTYYGMIIPLLVDAAGVFIMKNFFESIPVSVEESARIDGASLFRIYWSIVLPMARPALVTLFILSFQGSWNELAHFIISAQSTSLDTLTKGVAQLASGQLGSGNRYPAQARSVGADDDPRRGPLLRLPAADHERVLGRGEGIGASHGRNHLRQRDARPTATASAPSPTSNLEVEDGEFVVLVGPSGCGKTTALRMIAGLEEISDGEIRIGDRVVNDLPPRERDIAMVFQNYALYPHMTVAENIGFALRMRKVPKAEARRRIEETARIIGLVDHLDRKPGQLSGGQRQRVAMGRAIVREPQVFLMDEPLSNLDAKLRVQMRAEISRIQRQLDGHDRLRHARPGRGDDDGRPRRGDAPGLSAAVRRAAAPVRAAGQPVRRELHRQPRDERARRIARARRRRPRRRIGAAALALRPRCRASARARGLRRGGRSRSASGRRRSTSRPARRRDGGRLRGASQAVEALGPEQLVHVEIDAKPVLVEDVLEGLVDVEQAGDLAEIKRTPTAPARPSSPGSMRRRASGPTSRSSLRSTSATSTSSISTAARRSVPEPTTAI